MRKPVFVRKGLFTMAVHIQKRQGYISWDEYFMGVAILSGMRSKDPNSQVHCQRG